MALKSSSYFIVYTDLQIFENTQFKDNYIK